MKIVHKLCFVLVPLVFTIAFDFLLWGIDQNNTYDLFYKIGLQILLGLLFVILFVFLIILFSVRRSLEQINKLASGLENLKKGVYGNIGYTQYDEIHSITEKYNELSLAIKEKEEQAKKNELAREEFVAMVTHELKTPLVPIQGYADILLSGHFGNLDANQRSRIEIIRSSTASLLSLISDLLDAQKLELGQLRINKKSESIKSTLEKTMAAMSPLAQADEIDLGYELGSDIIVSYDDERIRQVLYNLIKNSFKATAPSTGKVKILVEDSANDVKISVKDNGKGIPKDAYGKIFKKFYQVDTSSTREKGGSGLGLAICKGIVEAHGGQIWFDSELNNGTTFTFTIPKESDPLQTQTKNS